jgi:hypothetical protein
VRLTRNFEYLPAILVGFPNIFLLRIQWYIIRRYLAGLVSAVTVLAFIHDLNIVAVRIKHPGRIIARIVFETSLR